MEQIDRRLIHLVNNRDNKPMENVPVMLRLPPSQRVNNTTLAGPAHKKDIQLHFKIDNDAVIFTAPKINTYETAVVGLE